jgi:hypothetical protein
MGASREDAMTSLIRTLLAEIVDYAGLFPPAALNMQEAVRNYAIYVRDKNSWALGRFIVPVARLGEFEIEAQRFFDDSRLWKLSVLAGPNLESDASAINSWNMQYGGSMLIDTIETKAVTVEEIYRSAAFIPRDCSLFVEIPVSSDPTELIKAIGATHANAKVRTGGVTANAFPASAELAQFIHICIAENVPFKATAGLHHPIRSLYSLTYDHDSQKAKMYGYLNVFLAAAFSKNGMSLEESVMLLEEESSDAFQFDDEGVSWRSHRLDVNALKKMRENVAMSFGSCSFREPIEDLKAMALL